jgi:hypothetical protein
MTETNEQPAQEQPSRSDAVRQILKEKGKKTSPTAIVALARERFGLEITPDYAAKTKSRILAEGKKKKGGRKAAKKEAAQTEPAAPPASAKAAAGMNGNAVIELDDLKAVEGLIERLGADELLRMIGVMAR